MPILIAITVYSVEEVRDALAKRTGWPKAYSRQRINKLVKEKIPTAYKIGKRYFLTETELDWLAEQLETKKRPKM